MSEHKLLSPCPFCGEKLFLDIDDNGVAILHSLKEKDCFFPSILEIEMPVGTTLEQMIEKINRRPIQESFEHAIVAAALVAAAREQDLNELHVELAALKSEIVSKDKKLTDYEKELRKLHNYDKTCSTCRYLDENQNCVLGIRCVNYALWQGRIL